MQNYNIQEVEDDQDEVIKNIKEIDNKIQEEFDKGEKMDEDKVMRLRFAQLMRGLYLNQTGINNY
jgi:hypothetical protein